MRYKGAVAAAYAAVMTAWVYFVRDTHLTDGSDPHPFWGGDAPLYLVAALHVAFGIQSGSEV